LRLSFLFQAISYKPFEHPAQMLLLFLLSFSVLVPLHPIRVCDTLHSKDEGLS